jgi:hypothetical protein
LSGKAVTPVPLVASGLPVQLPNSKLPASSNPGGSRKEKVGKTAMRGT